MTLLSSAFRSLIKFTRTSFDSSFVCDNIEGNFKLMGFAISYILQNYERTRILCPEQRKQRSAILLVWQ
jgi:hypothetical protein